MPEIEELMLAGAPAKLARMLGQWPIATVEAGGSSADDATELATNFCLVATSGPGQGVSLDYATGAAITALYNTGPDEVLVYPAPGDAFNDLAPDLPLTLGVGLSLIAIPSGQSWLTGSGGGISDAPYGGSLVYGRQNGFWVPVPAGSGGASPIAPLWVTGGGALVVTPGVGRIYVDCPAAVTLTLPPGDVLVADRGGWAGDWPVTCLPPPGATINGNPSFVLIGSWTSQNFFWDGANFGVGSAPLSPAGPPAMWVTAGGATLVPTGVGRVYVDCAAAVTLTLPANDVLVADRGPNAGSWPITCQPPAGAAINGNPGFVLVGDWAAQTFFWDGINFGTA